MELDVKRVCTNQCGIRPGYSGFWALQHANDEPFGIIYRSPTSATDNWASRAPECVAWVFYCTLRVCHALGCEAKFAPQASRSDPKIKRAAITIELSLNINPTLDKSYLAFCNAYLQNICRLLLLKDALFQAFLEERRTSTHSLSNPTTLESTSFITSHIRRRSSMKAKPPCSPVHKIRHGSSDYTFKSHFPKICHDGGPGCIAIYIPRFQ